jgi:hypothetical protein
MKRLALVLPVLLVAGAAFGGGLQKEQVPAGAKWVAHLDVEALVNSQLGQFLLKQLAAEGVDEKIKQFAEVFGFDPVKDLKSITAYGNEYVEEHGVAILRGTVNREKILALLEKNEGHKETKYGESTLHQWAEKKTEAVLTRFGCFYGDDLTVIASSMELLKAAVDVLDKKADSLAKGDLAAVLLVPSVGSIAMIAAQDIVPKENDPQAAMVKKLQAISAEIGEANKSLYGKIVLVTRNAKDAEDIRKVIDGLLAIVSLAGAQAADSDATKTQVLAMLKQIQVSGKEQVVNIEASWDVAQVTALLEQLAAAKKAKVKVDVQK